jgi:predicted RecA/RadA family phage recombinase
MSATTVKNNTRTFEAGEALDAYLLVKVGSNGTVTKATAAASEAKVGFTVEPAVSGAAASISLSHGGGTSYGIASEALSIGDKVYGDAGGKLAASGGSGDLVGITLTAATADGDVIEVATIY